MGRKPIWQKLSMKRLNQKDLQRAIRSIRRCKKSMSESEREGKEWALTLQWANDNSCL